MEALYYCETSIDFQWTTRRLAFFITTAVGTSNQTQAIKMPLCYVEVSNYNSTTVRIADIDGICTNGAVLHKNKTKHR